jgi:hypothetical protein
MVGKALEVCPSKSFFHLVEPLRVRGGFVDYASKFGVKLIGKAGGYRVIIGEGLLDVPPHKRVISYFHVDRN